MARVSLEEPRRPRRPALLALGVLLALGLVALASRGHAPTGSGGSSRSVNGELLFEYVVLFFLALALIVGPFMAHTLWTTRRHEELPKRQNWMMRTFVTMVLLAIIFTAVASWRAIRGNDSGTGGRATRGAEPTETTASGRVREAKPVRFDWAPVIVVGSLVLVGGLVAAGVLRRDRKRRRVSPDAIAARLSDVLDDTLDDLRGERDPRRAVIAAYARMERSLAWFGLPRRAFEAPLEYLARVLAELHASAESVTRLTALFERAKFSPHEIGGALKADAIDALVAVRDELRSYR